MWNKLTQVAGLGTGASDPEASGSLSTASEADEQLAQQDVEIQRLKDLLRENEKLFQEKNKELQDTNTKFQKFKLQSKAKICQLNNQVKELEKFTKKDEGEFEDTSSSDSSDQSKRGRVIMLKKQLEQAKQLIEKKEKEMEEMNKKFEAVVNDLQIQLGKKEETIQNLKTDDSLPSSPDEPKDVSQGGASVHEMYAQIVYKDSKIMELNNRILEHERKIMDLQEHIKEKDEVLQSRSRAIQLMTADMNRKGKSVVDELDEVRGQMRIMQENFAAAEAEWKAENDSLDQEIKEIGEKYEKDVAERDMKINNCEEAFKKLEATRYDLATKNAELQRKLIVVQENADKQCETLRNEMEEELQSLRRNNEQEKVNYLELQKALEEATNQSEAKVLKARVKERTKFKALERELVALKKAAEDIPDKETRLHQCIAELEEEKGSLQLKLMEVEEQIALQEELKVANSSLHTSLKETKERCEQAEIQALKLEKENDDLRSQLDEVKLQCEQLASEGDIRKYDEENKSLSASIDFLKDEKVSLEMKVIELEELREGDEHAKQDLLCQISELQDVLSHEKVPIASLEKENNNLKEKILQLENLREADQKELQNVVLQADCFQKKLIDLQNKHSNIAEENQKLKNENVTLITSLRDKEKLLTELKELETSVDISNEEKLELEITSLAEQYKSLQVLLDGLFSLCCVNDLTELKEKYLDMENNIKNLNSHILDRDIEVERYKQEYKNMVDEAEKLQLECQARHGELQSCFELIQNLKMHINDQENNYKEEINKLNQSIKDQEKEKQDLINVVCEKEKLLQKANIYVEEKDELIRNLSENVEQQSNVICQLEKQNTFSASEIEGLKGARKADSDKMQSKMSSMLEQITDLEAEVSKLQAEVSSKEESCSNLEKESNHFKALYEDLLKMQQTHNTVCQDQKRVLENLEMKVSSLENELEQKNREIGIVQKTLKDEYEAEKGTMLKANQGTINSLEITLNECQTEKDELLQINMLKESEIKELQSSLKKLNQKLDSETKKLEDIYHNYECVNNEKISLHHQLLEAKNQIQTLETKISDFSVSLADKVETNKKLLSDNLTLKEENAKLLCMANEAKLENALLTKQNNDISTELELKKNELSSISEALHNKVLEKDSLKQILAESVKRLEIAGSEIKSLEEKCLNLSDENGTLRHENSDLSALTKEQKLRIDEMNEKETVLQQQLKNVEEKLHQIEKQKTDVTEKVLSLERMLQMVEEGRQSSLEESRAQISALQEKIKILEEENASVKTEKSVLSDVYPSKLSNLASEINSYQNQLLCAKADYDECKNKLETEVISKLKFQEEVHRLEATEKYLRSALLSTFQENKHFKTSILSLKSEVELHFSQYASDLVHLQNELSVITNSFQQKEAELENSLSENAVLRDNNSDLSERLKNSNTLVQNVTEERDALQELTVKLKQQADDLMEKIVMKEEQYQLSTKQKTEEYEKQFANFQNNVENLTLFKTQYLFLANKLQSLGKHVSDQIEETTVDVESHLEFPKDFHVLEDITNCIESKYLHFKHETSRLSSEVKKLCDDKEFLTKFSQTIHNENDSLLMRMRYIEEEKDKLVSVFPSLSTEVSNLTKMNNVTLNAVLDSINSKELILRNMESSVAVLKKTFSVLKKQVEVLQLENSTMKDQIQCNNEEILRLQNINNDLLKEKEKSEVQCEEQKMQLKKLYERIVLVKALGNWLNEQSGKIECFTEQLQTSSGKNVLSPEWISTEKKALECENLPVGITSHLNVQCKECGSSVSLDDTVNELLEEQKRNKDVMLNLISALKDSEVSIKKLHCHIEELADEGSSFSKHKCGSELSSNSLQTEVQNLLSSLSTLGKENVALQQELQSITCQLRHAEADSKEKSDLLQAEVNRWTQINKELVEKLEEKNSILINKQTEYDELQQLQVRESDACCLAKQEINFLKSELEKICEERSKECEEVKQQMEKVLKHNSGMKMCIKDVCDMLCDKINCNPNLTSESDYYGRIDSPNIDGNVEEVITFLKNNISIIVMSLNEKQCKLQGALSDIEIVKTEKDNVAKELHDKINMCEQLNMEVRELKKSLVTVQEELKLYKDRVELETDTIKGDEHFSQVSSVAVEDRCLTEKLQKAPSEKRFCDSEGCRLANESLHHKLGVQKMKYDKMLAKFRLSRDQVEELHKTIKDITQANEKLRTSHDEVLMLQKQQWESSKKLQDDWKTSEEEKNLEIRKLNGLVKELKERNSLESSMGDKLRTELQQYKDLWEQCNSTFELQKEENEQLRLKVKHYIDELESANLKISDLNNRCIASDAEKKHLQHVVEGLKENINMLISDNDTFQELIEKLSQSKAALEKDVAKLKKNSPEEIGKLSEKFQSETDELISRLRVAEEQKTELSNLKEQYEQLKRKYCSLMDNNKFLENRIQYILKDKELLENQSEDLYNEFCRQTSELQNLKMITCAQNIVSGHPEELSFEEESEESKIRSVSGTPMSGEWNLEVTSELQLASHSYSTVHAPSENADLQDMKQQIEELIEEKQAFEQHIKYLTEELQSAMIKKEAVLGEYLAKEKQWRDDSIKKEQQLQQQIAYLQMQLLAATSQADLVKTVPEPVSNQNYNMLETELQQAMNNLHRQGLRCEELSLEVSKLLEERNDLRLKLNQCHQQSHEVLTRSGVPSAGDNSAFGDELSSVRVTVPSDKPETKPTTSSSQLPDLQADMTVLLQRLHESEEMCSKLRRAYEALDVALTSEKEQRKLLEDELGFAKEHIKKIAKGPDDEYQILLGDFEEPEMFAETNFSITRHMKSNAQKFHRWIRGRRNYLCRAVRSKNYSQFLYLFYLFAIHVWVIVCTFGHS